MNKKSVYISIGIIVLLTAIVYFLGWVHVASEPVPRVPAPEYVEHPEHPGAVPTAVRILAP